MTATEFRSLPGPADHTARSELAKVTQRGASLVYQACRVSLSPPFWHW
ncbi:MAG: hypothetical protein QOG46_689 [Pseudonocardiales bacterium]|nr:hypothetical protein [Pseudonocardiales bacterium]